MKCSKCGKEISENAKFCRYCGTPIQTEEGVSSVKKQKGVRKRNRKKWIIPVCIAVGILVVTGVTAFTIKITGENSKPAKKVEKNKKEDAKQSDGKKEIQKAETPEQAFENYLVFLVDAINRGDYEGAEQVMLKDSPLYQEQSKLVTKLYSENTKEELKDWSITSTEEIDDTHVRLISDEEYELTYSDGTVKTVPQSFAYECELTKQGWVMTTLEAVGGTSSSNKDAYIQAYQEYISANQEYLNKFREDYDGSVSQASYAIVDIQNDGIPEVILCVMNSYGGVSDFLYMGKDGTIKNYQDFYAWISYEQDTGLIFSSTGGGHMGISEGIFQYDENADTFQEIHGGGYLYGANADNECSDMKWDGVEYPTLEAYNAKIDEVFNRDAAEKIEYKDYTFDVDLLQEISNFEKGENSSSSNSDTPEKSENTAKNEETEKKKSITGSELCDYMDEFFDNMAEDALYKKCGLRDDSYTVASYAENYDLKSSNIVSNYDEDDFDLEPLYDEAEDGMDKNNTTYLVTVSTSDYHFSDVYTYTEDDVEDLEVNVEVMVSSFGEDDSRVIEFEALVTMHYENGTWKIAGIE